MSSTIKIKAPAMPEPSIKASAGVCCGNFTTGGEYMGQSETLCCGQPDEAYPDHYSADQLAARDAQWQEMVGPVVKALADALESVEDYMHGMEFGTCDRDAITNGRAVLSAITEE